jgi:hypothetical protein
MKIQQKTLIAKKGFSRKAKLGILGTLLIVIASAALVIAAEIAGLGGTIQNTGKLEPSGFLGSPLVTIQHNSMWNGSIGGQRNDPSQFIIVSEIQWETLYGVGSNTNSFQALNLSAIALYNNGSEVLYPGWQVVGLPSGYAVTCYVAVQITTKAGTNPPQLTWSGGYFWGENNFAAFALRPKDFDQANYYAMVFVLSALETAIPGPMNFQIVFAYSTMPS